MTSKDIRNAISSLGLAAGASHCALRDGQTIDLFGLEAVPANHSAQPESEREKQMKDICGLTGLGSLQSAALGEYTESKLRQLLPTDGGMMWPMIWKQKVTPSGRQYCQLAVSVSRTKGIDYGLWATPNTMDGIGDRSPEAIVRQFNTTRKGRTAPANLREQVNPAMWPTPNASDDRDRGRWENPRIQRRVAIGKQINLSMLVKGCNGSPAQTGKRGQLNPAFVSWLMGYSTAHLSSMLLAMRLYQHLRKNSSKPQESNQ
jgi:hypothetical protein